MQTSNYSLAFASALNIQGWQIERHWWWFSTTSLITFPATFIRIIVVVLIFLRVGTCMSHSLVIDLHQVSFYQVFCILVGNDLLSAMSLFEILIFFFFLPSFSRQFLLLFIFFSKFDRTVRIILRQTELIVESTKRRNASKMLNFW